MVFADKLIQLRREKGYSQEQLANMLNVSRQSVSKWEANQSMPELNKLKQLSDIFHVSIDFLVRDTLEYEEKDVIGKQVMVNENDYEKEDRIEKLAKELRGYEYKSKRNIKGVPLLHIRFCSHRVCVAKGIIAIGNVAVGVVSIGACSIGIFSIGACAVGILSLAAVALGLLSVGGVSVGILAIGGVAMGVYSLGATALGTKVAVGAAAVGKTAIGIDVEGKHILEITKHTTKVEVESFILQYNSDIPKLLLKLLSRLWGN